MVLSHSLTCWPFSQQNLTEHMPHTIKHTKYTRMSGSPPLIEKKRHRQNCPQYKICAGKVLQQLRKMKCPFWLETSSWLHREDALKGQLWYPLIREWREEHLRQRGQPVQRHKGTCGSMRGARHSAGKQGWAGSVGPASVGWTSSRLDWEACGWLGGG